MRVLAVPALLTANKKYSRYPLSRGVCGGSWWLVVAQVVRKFLSPAQNVTNFLSPAQNVTHFLSPAQNVRNFLSSAQNHSNFMSGRL